MGSIYLGADIGTTSAKCLAVSEEGHILALAQHPYGMSHPREGWAEQEPEDYWEGLRACVRGCLEQLTEQGRSPAQVVSLALSTQGDTLIVADDAGRAVRPAISWMDARADAEFHELLAQDGQDFWYRETGCRLTPYSSACAVRWLAANEPQTLARGRICWVPDFLANRLVGRYALDAPSASWTPLYNPWGREWSTRVAEIAGARADMLPEVLESGSAIGEVLPEASAELGLPGGVSLVAGAFDQAAAAHGAGAKPSGRSVLSCGTAWVLYVVAGSLTAGTDTSIPVCCHVHPQQWGLVLPFTGGTAYDWTRRVFGQQGETDYESPNQPLIFIPHLYGGLCPDWREESRGTIVGLTLSHTAADIEIAVMRGLGFEARRNLEACSRLIAPPGVIRMVGGATRSAFWPQLIADILGIPVEIWECAESACYGAARLAAGKGGEAWKGGETRVVEPRPANVRKEADLYADYLRAYAKALSYYLHLQVHTEETAQQ